MKKIIVLCLILISLACQTPPNKYWSIQVLSPGNQRRFYYHIYNVTIEETEEFTIINGYDKYKSYKEGSYEWIDPIVIQIPKDWTYYIQETSR